MAAEVNVNYLHEKPNEILTQAGTSTPSKVIFNGVINDLNKLSKTADFTKAAHGNTQGYDNCFAKLKEIHDKTQADLDRLHREQLNESHLDNNGIQALKEKQQQEQEKLTRAMHIAQQQALHAYEAGQYIRRKALEQQFHEINKNLSSASFPKSVPYSPNVEGSNWAQFVNRADRDGLTDNNVGKLLKTGKAVSFYSFLGYETGIVRDFGYTKIDNAQMTTNPDGSCNFSANLTFTKDMGVDARVAAVTALCNRLLTMPDPNNPNKPAITTFDLSEVVGTKTYSSIFGTLNDSGKTVALRAAANILSQYPEAKFNGLYNSDPEFQDVKFSALETYIQKQAKAGLALNANCEEIINAAEPYIDRDDSKTKLDPQKAFAKYGDINKMSLKDFLQHCANFQYAEGKPNDKCLDPQKVQGIIQNKSRALYEKACNKYGKNPDYREAREFVPFQAPGAAPTATLEGVGEPAPTTQQPRQEGVDEPAPTTQKPRVAVGQSSSAMTRAATGSCTEEVKKEQDEKPVSKSGPGF